MIKITTKVMKYKIIKPNNANWTQLDNILRTTQYQSFRFSNKAIQFMYDYSNFNFLYKDKMGDYLNLKETPIPNRFKNGKFSKQLNSDIRNELGDIVYALSGHSKTALIEMVSGKWKEAYSDFVNGRKSIINFKKDLPIELHNVQFKKEAKASNPPRIRELGNGKYAITIQLCSLKFAKEIGLNRGDVEIVVDAKKGSQKTILNRIINEDYKLSMSKISKDNQHWFLNLCYSFDNKNCEELDTNKIMGIDMGVAKPVYMAFNNNKKRYYIDGDEITHFKRGVQARRNSMLKQGKYCGEGRKGHGRSTRIVSIQKLQGKVENFKKTTNHKYSKYVIDIALKHNCGTIQMEDLTGIVSGKRKATFLGDWTYYDLQEKIKYKAESKGIKIIKVKPDYTSQRCSKCGVIDKDHRKTQELYHCSNCGFKANADYNASKNIAEPQIENIIKEQLEYQKSLMTS